jgi:two-component system alkaline phosphatase synthesis response regulator PhoP
MHKVLIVEDDDAMAVALQDGFEYEGFDVRLARDGEAGLEGARAQDPDLIILDVMLPKMSGLDVCKEIREAGSPVPIIMLTARGQEVDKVLGLRLGADDYMTKPFSFLELMARVEALMRRAGRFSEAQKRVQFGDVEIDFATYEATKGGQELALSPREFEILAHFVERRGKAVTREDLLQAVWGYGNGSVTRTVDMHIAKLRKKIECDPHEPRHIVTVHRVGYKFLG